MGRNGRRRGRREQQQSLAATWGARISAFVAGAAALISAAVTVHQTYWPDDEGPAASTAVQETRSGAPVPEKAPTAKEGGAVPSGAVNPGTRGPAVPDRGGATRDGRDTVEAGVGTTPEPEPEPGETTPPPLFPTPSPPRPDGEAGGCRWKVRWPSAGIFPNPSAPEPAALVSRHHVFTGACDAVTGRRHHADRETEQYYAVASGHDQYGAALAAGYVRAEAVLKVPADPAPTPSNAT